jgi:hypothetical protein
VALWRNDLVQTHLKAGALAALLVSLLLFAAPFSGARRLAYLVDQRPEQTLLFIGNSRTSWNDMPMMVQAIADSAGNASKLRIEMHAPGGVGLLTHGSDSYVHGLLSRPWDHVILQAQSSEMIHRPNWGRWLLPAEELITAAKQNNAVPAMFVTWRYAEQCPEDPTWNAAASAAMHLAIQQQHAELADVTSVELVNVGLVWEKVLQQQTDFSLYADCNHPSVYGSYLSALMFYGQMLGGDVAAVTYRPDAMHQHQADFLQDAVLDFLGNEAASGTSSLQTQALPREAAIAELVSNAGAERLAEDGT